MTEFWAELLETALIVGLAALVVSSLVGRLSALPAKHMAFALAIGLLLGRHQADGAGGLQQAGAGAGGLIVLGVLWFFWFNRATVESRNG